MGFKASDRGGLARCRYILRPPLYHVADKVPGRPPTDRETEVYEFLSDEDIGSRASSLLNLHKHDIEDLTVELWRQRAEQAYHLHF